jgi:putative transposase
MINPEHESPVVRQCELLDLARSTAYYEPVAVPETDLVLMRRLDELHLKWPFLGARRLRDPLNKDGFEIGRTHVSTLMRQMVIATLYRKRRTSMRGSGPEHRVYSYVAGSAHYAL